MSADLVPDRRLRLPDGRTLGFCIYGDPTGMPVLFLHGTPGSRLQLLFVHEVCKGLRVAMVAPDRWGYGLSEAPRRPLLTAYADDIAALMTHLGHARFCVGGVSGGAPYAAAVAACLASRVLAVAFVSPVGPIADAGLGPALSLAHRFNFTVAHRYPRVVATAFRCFHWNVRRTPRLAARLVTLRAARIDKELIAQPEISRRILASFREGLRSGTDGPQIDLSIFSRPWGIDLALISAPARVWIGGADRDVPIAAVRALAERIPHCLVTELAEEGHLWVAAHNADVPEWLHSVASASACSAD
jgi:pimeloyl-ACP methyl ester carboxylesterase